MTEPENTQKAGRIDLSKYTRDTEKSSDGYKKHNLIFNHTDTNEDWENRAYEVVEFLMKKKHMTMKDIKELLYEYVLDPVGEDMGI